MNKIDELKQILISRGEYEFWEAINMIAISKELEGQSNIVNDWFFSKEDLVVNISDFPLINYKIKGLGAKQPFIKFQTNATEIRDYRVVKEFENVLKEYNIYYIKDNQSSGFNWLIYAMPAEELVSIYFIIEHHYSKAPIFYW